MPPLQLLALPAHGPEDVALDPDGRVLTGVADGRVLRVDPGSGEVETLGDTGGRPLGVEPGPDGSVFVCDSVRGLLLVHPGGRVVPLVTRVDGAPLTSASNVVAADDGTLYFSSSSRRFDLDHWLGDILEHSGTGRLLRRSPDGAVDTLADGLMFANGVVLAPDGSCVLVAESGAYRITRHWLTGASAGTSDVLVDNLPGSPDNMSLGSDGLLWVALASARNPLLDRLLPLPGMLRQAVWALPARLRPAPERTAWVLGIAVDGTVVHDLQRADDDYWFVTGVAERAGRLYLGSLHRNTIAVTSVQRR